MHLLWKDKILVSFDELEGVCFSAEGLGRVLFIFAWGFAVTLILGLMVGRDSGGGRITET